MARRKQNLNTITPFKSRVGRLATIRRSLPSLARTIVPFEPEEQPRGIPLRAYGPKSLPFQTQPYVVKGPGEPPDGFDTATTSAEEWTCLYWPLAKVMRDPPDPRQPPFIGGRQWKYQHPFSGGRLSRGGQVIDAEVDFGGRRIAIRLMTSLYHAQAKREQQVKDMVGKVALSKFDRVCDIWTQAVIHDETGEAACQAVADCLRAKETPDPFTWGFRPTRSKTRRSPIS
jgi:hypothetical protein